MLDRVDSTFNMNITRTPETSDPEALRQRFEQLGSEPSGSIVAKAPVRPAPSKPVKPAAPKRKVAPKKKREEKPKGPEVSDPAKKEKKPKKRDIESEEEDDDDDDPLQVEYPGSERRHNDFSPAFPEHNSFGLRPFSDFAEKLRESGNELDDERSTSSDGGLNNFKLPSPVGKGGNQYDDSDGEDEEVEMEDVPMPKEDKSQQDLEAELEAGLESGLQEQLGAGQGDDGQGDLEADLERDLEAELENGLMMGNSGQDADAESEVSEED